MPGVCAQHKGERVKYDAAHYEAMALQAHEDAAKFASCGVPYAFWLQSSQTWATLALAAAMESRQNITANNSGTTITPESVAAAMRGSE